jgi:hypothetical protein
MDHIPASEIQVPEIKKGVYKHYKGDHMEVIGVALHSETLEPFVVYHHLTGEHSGETHLWVRPYAMFLENVEVDGKSVPRFEFTGDQS